MKNFKRILEGKDVKKTLTEAGVEVPVLSMELLKTLERNGVAKDLALSIWAMLHEPESLEKYGPINPDTIMTVAHNMGVKPNELEAVYTLFKLQYKDRIVEEKVDISQLLHVGTAVMGNKEHDVYFRAKDKQFYVIYWIDRKRERHTEPMRVEPDLLKKLQQKGKAKLDKDANKLVLSRSSHHKRF